MTGKKIPVFDGHCDTATRLVTSDEIDISVRSSEGHVDIPRMREGGVCAQVFACWVDPDTPPEKWGAYTLKMIRKMRRVLDANSTELSLALSGSQVLEANRSGRMAALIGVEGGHAIGGGMEMLRRIYEEGVRCMTLTWNHDNEIADSCEGSGSWGGLSPFGREVIAEMDSAGMVVDLSHSSDGTFYDVLETTSSPVLVSHSCMRA
ncbi:MAG TPA: membrane dipeptidase, partial [Candidatus Krumholzibacterium sp.]|nr:membrane dipeptidase [Candidatus Krumholzibacterium sp.]